MLYIIPNQNINALNNIININQNNLDFINSLPLNNTYNQQFYTWIINEYKNINNDTYDIAQLYSDIVNNPHKITGDLFTHSLIDVIYMLKNEEYDENKEYPPLPKGPIPNQAIEINGITMYIINLIEKDELELEGKLMNHCVGSYYEQIREEENKNIFIYSLRDINNKPHATIELRGKIINQCQGNSNRKVNEEYMQYINKWMNDNGIIDWDRMIKRLNKMNKNSIEYKNLVKYYEDIIIDGGNAYYIYEFASGINGANINKLQEAVINSGKLDYICDFAEYVKGANINELQEAIINSGNAEYIYRFALGIKGVDINKLQEAVINSGNAEYIYRFAKYIKGANINKLQEAVINSGNAKYIYYFARYIKGANINLLQEAIINSGNVYYIYDFAIYIKWSDINRLKNVLKSLNSNLWKKL